MHELVSLSKVVQLELVLWRHGLDEGVGKTICRNNLEAVISAPCARHFALDNTTDPFIRYS